MCSPKWSLGGVPHELCTYGIIHKIIRPAADTYLALDTVDYNILFQRLKTSFGVTGTAFNKVPVVGRSMSVVEQPSAVFHMARSWGQSYSHVADLAAVIS